MRKSKDNLRHLCNEKSFKFFPPFCSQIRATAVSGNNERDEEENVTEMKNTFDKMSRHWYTQTYIETKKERKKESRQRNHWYIPKGISINTMGIDK